MPDFPTGTVTLLFTDIEGSTKLLHDLGDRYADVLADHRRALRKAFGRHGGVEVDTQGDAFFYAFASASDAVAAAAEGQDALAGGPVAVRMGIHTGEPTPTEEGYVGADVHRAARIMGAGHGGQVLVSETTRGLLDATLELLDLGEHRLKDIAEPVPIFQLGHEAFPPLTTISNTNLPRPASSFVGRARELDEVLALLRQQSVRLLTLTGPGGSGKTRLAIEAAAALVGEYSSGVFWVALARLRDPALVTETIAQVLGAKDALTEHIGERDLLLLLDNLEHVVEAAPELAALLEACPNLHLLVTSRELLRVRGELEYAVPPLTEPDAVELFCTRAQLEPERLIAELCRRLDNLPLAVELAAARTSVLTPQQILERLSQRLDLLKGGRDAEARQQTLRATIEWSYDLLAPEAQQLFARLSVFRGGCTLAAAEDVAEADVDSLESLVDKSLLRFLDERYWMLETIREYAFERLAEGVQRDSLHERLAQHLMAIATSEGAPLFRTKQAAAFDRLEAEHANTRVVMEWALLQHRWALALELVGLLWQVWIARGHVSEAGGWLDAVLDRRGAVPNAIWAGVLIGACDVMKARGESARVKDLAEELVETLADDVSIDRLSVAAALADLSDIAREEGDRARAREYAERSLAVRQAHGLPGARALSSLGELALDEGHLETAEHFFEDAVRDYAGAGHDLNYVRALRQLGEVGRRRGDQRRAFELFADALRRSVVLGDLAAVGEALQDLALVASDRRQMGRAGKLWGAGEALREASGAAVARRPQEPWLSPEAKAAGAVMTLDEAVQYALDEPGASIS